MLEFDVRIVNQLGLHARAAAQLVKLTTQFKSSITIQKVDGISEANGKSILGVLSLAAAHGTAVRFKIDGADSEQAKIRIEELFKNGFGEL